MLRIADAAWIDLRQAVRRISRTPVLSLVVVVTLALAIAANATILSLLKPTVLQTLRVRDPGRLVSISATDAKTNAYSAMFVPAIEALGAGLRSFASLGACTTSLARLEFEQTAFDTPVEGVTAGFFDVLGVRARSGRLITAADDPLAPIGVITERLATRLFGNGEATGRTILLDSRPVEIIGVTGAGFTGVRLDGGSDVFLPLHYMRALVSGDAKAIPRSQMMIGRLAPDADLEQARAEVLGRWPSVQAAVAGALPTAQQSLLTEQRLSVDSFARGFSGTRDRYGRSLMLVMALAAALLAAGCVNLSGLMLARGLTRQHEFAVRIAMGAGRARLLQQVVIDGVLLSLVALVAALPLAWWASQVLTSMVSVTRATPIGDTTPDWQIVLLAIAIALAAGVAIGLLPARRAFSVAMDDVLRGRGTSHRLRGATRAILIVQIAISMILVVGAGLFAGTLANLYANDITERPHPILFTRLARQPLERATLLGPPYFMALQRQLQSIPGADAAAFSDMYPAYMAFFTPIPTETVIAGEGVQAAAIPDYVSPGLFDLYSITRRSGRDFTWADSEGTPPVVVINETLARRLFSSLDAVGRHVQIVSRTARTDAEIVGVVADATVTSIRERHVPGFYRPMMQDRRFAQTPMTHVRVIGDVAAVQRGYVEAVNAAGRHFVRGMFTMDGYVDNAVVEQRLIAGMSGVAATLAMVLAAVGLFGLLAYSVSSRVREIGVRVSIGATDREVVRMIVKEGLVVALPGIAIGVPLALGAAWLLRSQLYGVSATDPKTIAGAALLFAATAVVASWLPARRASRIQPMDALRQD